MATKAQHERGYTAIPAFLRNLREEALLTQRELGRRLGKPQSWVFNCETGNRRVDITEFVAWVRGCGSDLNKTFSQLLRFLPESVQKKPTNRHL